VNSGKNLLGETADKLCCIMSCWCHCNGSWHL